jgi:hypothetical protein
MKKNEVPQDHGMLGHLKEIAYAQDENGRYVLVPSVGWEAKTIANQRAWDMLNQMTEDMLRQVRAGRLSPLAYHMAARQLDEGILAKYVGLAKWRVKRHLRPEVFQKLKPAIMQKYSDFFGLSPEELRQVPPE